MENNLVDSWYVPNSVLRLHFFLAGKYPFGKKHGVNEHRRMRQLNQGAFKIGMDFC